MALPPQKFREIVFQLLFSREFAIDEPVEMIAWLMRELKVTKRTMVEANARADLVVERLSEIDEKIATFSKEYSFERISKVEKTILRLALFEILFDPAIPPKVAMAEAIRMGRKFGSPEGSQFVNGLLDSIFHATAAAGALA